MVEVILIGFIALVSTLGASSIFTLGSRSQSQSSTSFSKAPFSFHAPRLSYSVIFGQRDFLD